MPTSLERIFMAAADSLYPVANPYAADPVGWAGDVLGVFLWSKQREILEALRDHRRVAVHSAMGVGKSFVAAVAALWWISTRTPGKARVITTAPSQAGMEDAVWFELPQLHASAKLAGYVTRGNQPSLVLPVGGVQLPVAIGRKPADPVSGSDASVAASNLRGRHAPEGVLFIVDEAAGIQEWVFDTAGDITTEDVSRVLVIGNPDYEGSRFWRECQEGSTFHVMHLDVFDSPNFTGETVPAQLAGSMPSQVRVDEVIEQFGAESPAYQIKVRGLFPADQSDGVIPMSWLRQCQGVEATNRIGPLREPVELGVDLAGSENGDFTVIAGREGMRAMAPRSEWRLRTADPGVIVERIVGAIRDTRASAVKLDYGGGYGMAVYEPLRRALAEARLPWFVDVVKVDVSSVATLRDTNGKPRFRILKDQIWWEGRELARLRAWDVTDLDEQTVAQLTDVRWIENMATGRIQIETKAEVKRRTGRSPDDGDATLLAFHVPQPVGGYTQSAQVVDRRLSGRR